MGIDVTICLHSVTPTVPESVSFLFRLEGQGVLLSFVKFAAPLNGELCQG